MEDPGVYIVLPCRFCIAPVYFGNGHNYEHTDLGCLVLGIFFVVVSYLPKHFKFKNLGPDLGSGSSLQAFLSQILDCSASGFLFRSGDWLQNLDSNLDFKCYPSLGSPLFVFWPILGSMWIAIPILQAFPLWLACFLELRFDLGISQVHWQKMLTPIWCRSPQQEHGLEKLGSKESLTHASVALSIYKSIY